MTDNLSFGRLRCRKRGCKFHAAEEDEMTYTKPEVAVLGDAARIVTQTRWKAGLVFDHFTGTHTIAPAYDLDD